MNTFLEPRAFMLKEARSGLVMENVQEVLDSETSAKSATQAWQNQYFTPSDLWQYCLRFLPTKDPATVLDPQCGKGNLLELSPGYHWGTQRFGIELDNRIESVANTKLLTGNCVKVAELLDELYPDLRFVMINANPPFGKRLKVGDSAESVDSTEWTWQFALKRGNMGCFIANKNTMEKLGIDKHPWTYRYETKEHVWPNCEVVIGIAWWQRKPDTDPATQAWRGSQYQTASHEITEAWNQIATILKEEKAQHSKWNISLDNKGYLRTYLSTRNTLSLENKRKLDRAEILKLHKIDKTHPLTLTTERESRDLMNQLVTCGFYTIEPAAKAAVEEALASVNKLACPIMDPSDLVRVAYCDEEDMLPCDKPNALGFIPGQSAPLKTGCYRFTTHFTRKKVHFDEHSASTYTAIHECSRSGQDRYIDIVNPAGQRHRFMDCPEKDSTWQHQEGMLWDIFRKPAVPTVRDINPAAIAQNLAVLRSCEKLCGYQYYPGQLEYLARVGVKDHGLVAAATGTGKSLFALSLIAMKSPERCLIIAPQGTMRSGDEDDEGEEFNASQWVTEIGRFAPYLQIYELFSFADYQRICSLNGGVLPAGAIYVTYFQALFQNGARESCPDTWDDARLEKEMRAITGQPITLPVEEGQDPKLHCRSIGEEKDGIRCIMQPCMATLIGSKFDMILVDEAQFCTNLDANVTQMLIRLEPKYRYALTATPIPNIISNLFSLMGWLCVDGWHKGGLRNAAWPYAREEIGRFNDTFLSMERDHTEEARRAEAEPGWRGKCIKESPVISSPARLLKLISPTMAYISKKACNPDYREAKVIDVRVPLGKEQAVLYGYFMNRANIPAKHPLVRARKQTAWLRGICADPHGFSHGGPRVSSNMNPKMIATLELIRDILAKGEQVLIVSARVGFTNCLQDKLSEARVPMARIDSTVSPDQHSHQANLFKAGRAKVMLMGLKCAASHSFSQCIYTIITSLEFSPGSLTQACGRTDRVNSRPGVTIYCILHEHSIEEMMFDLVHLKNDASELCLQGKRVPRDYKPLSAADVFAAAFDSFTMTGAQPEAECEDKWPLLQAAIRTAVGK